jgi:hypothetical protein
MQRRTRRLLHGPLRYAVGHSQLTLGKEISPLVPVNAKFYDPAKLRKQLDDDGYLYFKNIIPPETIGKALADVAKQLVDNEWLRTEDFQEFIGCQEASGGYSMGIPFPRAFLARSKEDDKEPLSSPSPSDVKSASSTSSSKDEEPVEAVSSLPPPKVGFSLTKNIQEAVAGLQVMALMRQVFSGMVVAMPHHSLELSAPGEAHGFHMDSVYLQKGTKLVLTAWIPLHHTPLSIGGLCVAKSSNNATCYEKIRKSYGLMDVESAGIRGDGSYTYDGHELQRLGLRQTFDPEINKEVVTNDTPLCTASFQAGDVVLTTMYTMHSFFTNNSNFWRVSGESRWLMDGDDVGMDPRHSATGDALGRWAATRHDPTLFPRTMEDAKKEWGLSK